MRRLLTLPLIALLLGAAPPPPPAPPITRPQRPERIVSLNLCADQLVLALADRSQIAALTRLSRDPEMSAAADRAAGLPVVRGSAEDVLTRRADLLIVSPGRLSDTMAQLRGRRVRMLDLPPAESYAAIVAQVRQVGAAVGHPDRAERLIAAMDARLAQVPRPGRGRVAAYYQRRGYLTGTGTLVDELMTRVGLANLAARSGTAMLGRLSLEQIALARPDYLIVETATDRVVDQGTEMLHHPLLNSIPRLRLPQSWTVCGGPAYVRAATSLAEQLAPGARAQRR